VPATLTRLELNRATLARQLLLEREPLGATEAIERITGMQAQEPRHPFGGLWSRVEGFSPDDLLGALSSREVVRATLMRSTLHLMSAADFGAVRMALQPPKSVALRVLGARSQGLDVDAVVPAARELLAGNPLTFDEIRAALVAQFPDVNDRALGYAVRTLVPLVVVPDEDGRWGFARVARFMLAEEWLGEPVAEADPAALVRRYLRAFGPASVKDAQSWSGVGALKVVFEGMRDELEVFADERGRELFDLPGAPRPDADVAAPPRYLPEFDNLVLAHDDRSRVIADEHRPLVTTKNLRVKATFLVDGVVAGTWRAEVKRKVATLQLEPFAKLNKRATQGLEREGDALLRFAEPGAKAWEVRVGESSSPPPAL
jgi:hypothetical protein